MRHERVVARRGAVVLALVLALSPLQAATPTTKPKAVNYIIGQKVEVKTGLSWRDAVVKNKGNGWILVNYTPGTFHEWVAPWRVRMVGSTEDNLPFITPGDTLFRPQPPPGAKPPPPPDPDAPRAAPMGRRDRPGRPAGAGAASAPSAPANTPASLPALPLKQVDLAGVKEIQPAGEVVAGWPIAPDASEQPKTITGQPIALTAGSAGFFVRPERLLFATPATATAYVMHLDHSPGTVGGSSLERVDLAAGKSVNTLAIPYPIAAHDISRDGSRLLAVSADRSGDDDQQRVDIWEISGSQPKHLVSFRPVSESEQRMSHYRTIMWGRFASPEHILLSTAENLTCWELANARAIWSLRCDNGTAALSPGGKYLAVGVSNDVVFLEPLSGKVLAKLPTDRPVHGTLSFRRDGRLLAHAGRDILHVWDLATGKVLLSSFVDVVSSRIDWIGDGYLLLGGSTLFDLKRQIAVWQYTGPQISGSFAGRFWYITGARDRGGPAWSLTSIALPDPATLAEVARVGDDVYALKPGMPVTVDVGGLPGELQDKARDAITRKLTSVGLLVAENQPIRVIARIEPGKTTEITYRSFGARAFDDGTKMSVTSQVSKLQIVGPDGQTLWERQASTSPPMSLSLKEGQTIDQAVAEYMKATGWLFENTNIPSRISKVKEGFGTTTLTSSGIGEVKPASSGK